MSDHYFSNDPKSKSNPSSWKYMLRNEQFIFTSDVGVFSKNEVDFGSKLLVEVFEEPEVPGPILDVGCGYGPIGLALAKAFTNREVYMIDVNKRAIELAKQNAQKNNLQNVNIFESDRFVNIDETRFAAILTNPPIRAGKKIVHDILEESYHYLTRNGSLWVVIQKKQGAPSAIKKLESIFDQVSVVKKEKGYFVIRAERFD
jgi:16S rRNA (guanine1207-N2)-methyltransferase